MIQNIDLIILLCHQEECQNIIPDYITNFSNLQSHQADLLTDLLH